MRQAERQRVLDEVAAYFDERRPDLAPGTVKVYVQAVRILMEQYGMTRPERGQWSDAVTEMNREELETSTKAVRRQALVHWAEAFHEPIDLRGIKLGRLHKNREPILSPEERTARTGSPRSGAN